MSCGGGGGGGGGAISLGLGTKGELRTAPFGISLRASHFCCCLVLLVVVVAVTSLSLSLSLSFLVVVVAGGEVAGKRRKRPLAAVCDLDDEYDFVVVALLDGDAVVVVVVASIMFS